MNLITLGAKRSRRYVHSANWYPDMCRAARRRNRRRVNQELHEIAKDYQHGDDTDIVHVKHSEMVTGYDVS